ncbi:MAG: YkgJ family cysteine cluster protein [Actinomycetota bacterium]
MSNELNNELSKELSNDMNPGKDKLGELDRQVERGALFMHASFDRIAARARGIEDRLVELIDVLEGKGVIDGGELTPPAPPHPTPPPADPTTWGDPPEQPPVQWPALALRGQVGPPKPAAEVNCAERMHICHAVCCKLNFALTAQEVDAGKVRFDLGFPYMIRHDADGFCTHNNRETGFCGVYADRPGICRHYSCAGDTRIWKDFEGMELNHEWLDANLGDPHRIRLRLDLPLMEG